MILSYMHWYTLVALSVVSTINVGRRILESNKANMASILGYFGSLRWDGEGLTVPLYSIVSRLEVSYRIRLDFKGQIHQISNCLG